MDATQICGHPEHESCRSEEGKVNFNLRNDSLAHLMKTPGNTKPSAIGCRRQKLARKEPGPRAVYIQKKRRLMTGGGISHCTASKLSFREAWTIKMLTLDGSRKVI